MTLPPHLIKKSKFLSYDENPVIDTPQPILDLFYIEDHLLTTPELHVKAHVASKYGLPLTSILQEVSCRMSKINSLPLPLSQEIFQAVLYNDLPKVKNIFPKNFLDNQNRNILHIAARYNRHEIIHFLQYRMPNNLLDQQNHTPLYKAAIFNHLKSVRLLLKTANPLSAIFNPQGVLYQIPTNIRKLVLKHCPKYFWNFLLNIRFFNSEIIYNLIEIHLNITNTKYYDVVVKLARMNFEEFHTPDSAFVYVFGKIDP
jgi:Ankyrin repeats (3 copies)